MTVTIRHGDCREVLRTLPDESVHCCVTSPPYFGLRDYGVSGQIGLEPTPDAFVAEMVDVFREVRRVLRNDGTLWLNLGDSYAGYHGNKNAAVPTSATNGWTNGTNENSRTSTANRNGLKSKDLIGIPWRVAFALQSDGWYLRQDIIWSKPNPMPESVTDRCTKAHEYIFMLSKSRQYHYDIEAIKEPMTLSSVTRLSQDVEGQAGSDRVPGKTNGPMKAVGKADKQRGHGRRHAGFNERWDAMERVEQCSGMRNKRSVWSVATQPFSEAHFATFPPELIEPCIKAGCPAGAVVLDPFGGAGTTGLVADRLGRDAILIELNPEYAAMAERRISGDAGMFANVERVAE
jgi:DNA modification methylase